MMQKKFTAENGYDPAMTIGDIMPPCEPSAQNIFKKLLTKYPLESKYLTQFCKDLTHDKMPLKKFQLPPLPSKKSSSSSEMLHCYKTKIQQKYDAKNMDRKKFSNLKEEMNNKYPHHHS